jgi:23S rRNA pseudouridine955/2504/2580 synthase
MSGVEMRTVTGDEAEIRLDRWFKRHFPDLGHGRLEKLLRTGQVRIDGARAKAGDRLASGQTIRVPPLGLAPAAEAPAAKRAPRVSDETLIALQKAVLYRDEMTSRRGSRPRAAPASMSIST